MIISVCLFTSTRCFGTLGPAIVGCCPRKASLFHRNNKKQRIGSMNALIHK